MVATKSTMQELGSLASDFSLPNVSTNEPISLTSQAGKPLLLMFICNHCPFVIHLVDELVGIANSAQKDGFFVAAISANDADSYPQDGPLAMQSFATDRGFEFPYLYDESQQVAKSYGAACTPDFYVFDAAHALRYRGQMDDSRPSNSLAVTGSDLKDALGAVLTNSAVNENQSPSIGCNIKWKPGNEPSYFL